MKLNQTSVDLLVKNTNDLLSPAQCLQDIVTAYTDYKKLAEQEKTEREQIQAWEKTEVARINNLKTCLIKYLEQSFDERQENFQKMFELIDGAILTNNNEQLALVLNAMTDLAKSNPLSDLNSVRAALNDPNYVWEF